MLEVVSLVQQFLPGLLKSKRPAVACIQTTRPKYLVFDDDSTLPACVVECGDAERLLRVHDILLELASRAPGLVARSLYCGHVHGATFVHIQEGLPGVPWFRVSDGLATFSDWRHLLERAISAIIQLHSAIGEVPEWTGHVDVRAELVRQVKLLESRGISLSVGVQRCVKEWVKVFGANEFRPSIWQHGDFSLNNLLIARDSMAVIDFDEFGGTLVPLHDAFGLALSFPLSQERSCLLALVDCVMACVEQNLTDGTIAKVQLPGLLMHHLLWRINQCHGLVGRAALRRVLLGWVDDLARAPEMFVGNLK